MEETIAGKRNGGKEWREREKEREIERGREVLRLLIIAALRPLSSNEVLGFPFIYKV